MRGLVQAARGQLRVDVDYVSLSSEEQSGRNIVPHTLVYDGIRWHVRAYCEKKGDISGLCDEPVSWRNLSYWMPPLTAGIRIVEWNTQVTAVVIPNPALSARTAGHHCQ